MKQPCLLLLVIAACAGRSEPEIRCDGAKLAEGLGLLTTVPAAEQASSLARTLAFSCELPDDVRDWLSLWASPSSREAWEERTRTVWSRACPGEPYASQPDEVSCSRLGEDAFLHPSELEQTSSVEDAVIGAWIADAIRGNDVSSIDARRVGRLLAGLPTGSTTIDRGTTDEFRYLRGGASLPIATGEGPPPLRSCAPVLALTSSKLWVDGRLAEPDRTRDVLADALRKPRDTGCPRDPRILLIADPSTPRARFEELSLDPATTMLVVRPKPTGVILATRSASTLGTGPDLGSMLDPPSEDSNGTD